MVRLMVVTPVQVLLRQGAATGMLLSVQTRAGVNLYTHTNLTAMAPGKVTTLSWQLATMFA